MSSGPIDLVIREGKECNKGAQRPTRHDAFDRVVRGNPQAKERYSVGKYIHSENSEKRTHEPDETRSRPWSQPLLQKTAVSQVCLVVVLDALFDELE